MAPIFVLMSVLPFALYGLKEEKALTSATVTLPPRLASPTTTDGALAPEQPERTRAAANEAISNCIRRRTGMPPPCGFPSPEGTGAAAITPYKLRILGTAARHPNPIPRHLER